MSLSRIVYRECWREAAAGGYVIYIPDIMKVPEEVKEGITAELPELSCVTEWIKERKQEVMLYVRSRNSKVTGNH